MADAKRRCWWVHGGYPLYAAKDEFECYDKYIWQFTGGKTLRNPGGLTRQEIVAKTPESDGMSKELLRRGFMFVGSTICYAFMQAVGMVDDHVEGCWKYKAR